MMMAENENSTAYSSSTPAGATNRASVIAPGAGVGRRKKQLLVSALCQALVAGL